MEQSLRTQREICNDFYVDTFLVYGEGTSLSVLTRKGNVFLLYQPSSKVELVWKSLQSASIWFILVVFLDINSCNGYKEKIWVLAKFFMSQQNHILNIFGKIWYIFIILKFCLMSNHTNARFYILSNVDFWEQIVCWEEQICIFYIFNSITGICGLDVSSTYIHICACMYIHTQ